MTSLRRLLANSPGLALWLVAAALAVRLLVPAGYMLSATRPLAPVACPGVTPVAHHGHAGAPAHQAPDQPCAFAALATPLAVAAAVVLAAVILLIAATPTPPPRTVAAPRAPPRWRPPLRAPPLAPLA